MLVALEKNKHVYEEVFSFNVDEVRRNIVCGIDDTTVVSPQWFIVPDCAQVVADAYNIPVCVYPDPNTTDPSITHLPVANPLRPKVKVQPFHLQNQSNVHWVTFVFGHLQTKFPHIQNTYFQIHPSYENLFKTTWNHWSQFPKRTINDTYNPEHKPVETV